MPPGGKDAEDGVVHPSTDHRAQLAICHEKIGQRKQRGGRLGEPRTDAKPPIAEWTWCNLPSAAWCFDCDYGVCEMHLLTRHEWHRTQPE